jgi:HPt (histidine-containing phosphotransfer) domain-containing protein
MLAWLERWLLAAARTRESDSDLDPFVEDSASGGEQSAVTVTDIFGTSTGASGDDRSEESPDAVRVETVQEQAPAEVEEELATAAGAAQELGALVPEPSDVDPAPSEVPSAPGGASESGTDFVEPDFASVGEILDVSILEPLFEDADGRELALELVASFLEMAPELLNRMEEAVGADDLEACARIAHRFVSTSGTVGANQLATLLKDIEQQAIAGRAEDAASLVSGCHELVELAGGALRTALAGGDGARS